MRPGPRLVVMALAFISGAQRGTTNTHNSANYKDNKLVGRNNLNNIYDIGQLDDDRGPLARVNPWLSACDLAPHRKSPDLQGQCTAGTLPVTRIEEGPGPPQPPPPECPLSCREQKQQKLHQQQHNNSKSNKLKNMEITGIKKQECLSYLGEANEFSPEYLCKRKSSIETQLKNLRLRHCCERDALSALHYQAYLDVIKGNESMCVKRIKDLIETDQLASRITCELTEILTRFDCKKPYSLINHCDDCREAYRRWVCSTFIPYFASESDAKRMDASGSNSNSPTSKSIQHRKTRDLSSPHLSASISLASFQSSSITKNNDSSNPHNSLTLPTVIIRRSRRKSHSEPKRIRIRPCLSVCQSVETKCPYLLPGDRAPALPTQYAGEPTFLCHDPNVHETVEQAEKSNNGPDDCCYWYCGGPHDGLCTNCPAKLFSNITHYDGLPRLANDTTSSKTENLSAAAVHKQQQQIQLHKLMEQTNVYSESRCPIYNWTGPQTCVLQYPGPYFNISSALKKVKVNQHESGKQNYLQKSSSFAVLSCSPSSIATSTLLSQLLINIYDNDNRIWTEITFKVMLIIIHFTKILQSIIVKIAWTNITHINKFLLQLAEL